MTDPAFPCPHCDRLFSAANDRWQHAKVKHGRRAAAPLRPPREEGEESVADLTVRAASDPDSELDWVRKMFDLETHYDA